MPNNTIQIFGLPRSGTNFVEWCVVRYFKDVTYKNKFSKCDVEGLNQYNNRVAYKHVYPTLDVADAAIVIYKEYDLWKDSYKRAYKKTPSEDVWKKYIKKSKTLPEDKRYIVEHAYMFNNLEKVLLEIAEKFDLTLKPGPYNPPIGRLDRAGANARVRNREGKFQVGNEFINNKKQS